MTFTNIAFASAFIIALAARHKKDKITDFAVALVFALYPFVFGTAMVISADVRTVTLDGWLRRADQSMGLDSFVFMRYFWAHHWLVLTLALVYIGLPLMLALGWMIERSIAMLRATIISPVLALGFYALVPGVGPMHAFSDSSGTTLLPTSALAGMPRNAFPSMHLTWAMLIALNARDWRWRIASWIFVALTALATIGSGEHYYIDLVAAVPFCLAIQWFAESKFFARKEVAVTA